MISMIIELSVCHVFQGTVLIKSAQELLNYTRGEEEQVEQVKKGHWLMSSQLSIDPIHAAAMTDKKRGLTCRFTANVRIST